MKEKITPYLRAFLDLPGIAGQYLRTSVEDSLDGFDDPLMEDSHEPVRGLIHKYPNRALIKVSYRCAAHCRFCTRIRQIGDPAGTLHEEDVAPLIRYLSEHPEIEDVILSGGDPLVTPAMTATLIRRIREIPSVKVLRIGTRLPLQAPEALRKGQLPALLDLVEESASRMPFYLLLHVNHPGELTPEAREAILSLRSRKVTLLSQTVLLKTINDQPDTMIRLCRELYHLGVTPYYLYRCDAVQGLERFLVDPETERAIYREMRAALSGIACPLLVEDVAGGYGKKPIG
jgi:lysine 2,3-aminomutase